MLAENDKGESTVKFQKGNNLARGGKRRGAGRPTKAELGAREAELDAREAMLTVWEREVAERKAILAKGYADPGQALRDMCKTILPDAT